MIKLAVSDVDGTLVEEGKGGLNPEYYDVIRQLHKKNIQVIVASGRSYSSIMSLFHPVEDLVWVIADGGGVVKTTGDIQCVKSIPNDWAKELWKDMSQIPTAEATFCCPEIVYIPNDHTFMSKVLRDGYKMNLKAQNGWTDFPPEPANKISLFCKENIAELSQKYILPQWHDKLYTVIAGEWWLDCMMPGINKGAALQAILDEFGYTPDEVMATGDNMNDLEMITLAGTGLAVSSARDEVKKAATRVIENFETDGVLKEWKKLL